MIALTLASLSLSLFSVARAADFEQDPPVRSPQGDERPDDRPGPPAAGRGVGPGGGATYGPATHVQVNVDSAGQNIIGDAGNEPSLAVDPNAPNRIAIGWRQFDTISSNFRQAGVGFTTDGGRTWDFPGVIEPGVFRSDPVLEADSSGSFFYNSLWIDPQGVFLTDVFRSRDAGRTWDTKFAAFGGDKAWMTIDRSAGVGDGHIYCAWSSFAGCCGIDNFTRSTDGGASFSNPAAIAPIFGTLAVAADGTLYVGGVDPGDFSTVLVARSANAKDAGANPTFTTTSMSLGGALALGEAPNPGGLGGQVWIAVDPCCDDVYLLATVVPFAGDPMDVHFSRSSDGGQTWSPFVRVNDDPAGNGAWQWFGTMSVAPDGRIDAVWNDTRNTGQANMSQLFTSSSTDGGLTWSTNEALSSVWNSHVGWPNQSKIGDYYDMLSDQVGADLAWSATFNGEQDVYYTRIGDYDCNGNGVGDSADLAGGASSDDNGNGIPDECECFASSYCQATDNSSGEPGRLAWSGSLSIAANALSLHASDCPPNQNGVFFYGAGRGQATLGNGVLCIDPAGGLFRLKRVVQTSSAGDAALPLDFTTRPLGTGAGMALPFSTWNFQFWFRDPAGGGSNFNLTEGLELTFCP